jgi:DMSO/TMAO reductase YedYZ heme-binding membrane subunit
MTILDGGKDNTWHETHSERKFLAVDSFIFVLKFAVAYGRRRQYRNCMSKKEALLLRRPQETTGGFEFATEGGISWLPPMKSSGYSCQLT